MKELKLKKKLIIIFVILILTVPVVLFQRLVATSFRNQNDRLGKEYSALADDNQRLKLKIAEKFSADTQKIIDNRKLSRAEEESIVDID